MTSTTVTDTNRITDCRTFFFVCSAVKEVDMRRGDFNATRDYFHYGDEFTFLLQNQLLLLLQPHFFLLFSHAETIQGKWV